MSEVEALKDAIRKLHGCEAEHLESVPVLEDFRGEVVWDGVVEVFAITGHAKASRCYAWKHKLDDGGERFIAVLELPPVNSARTAVRAAIVSESRSK